MNHLMVNDNLAFGKKPPDSTYPPKGNEVVEFRIVNEARTSDNCPGAGANTMVIPYALVPFSPLPFGNTHGTPQPYNQGMPQTGANLITDVSQFNNTQNPKIDHNFIYGKGNTHVLCRPVPDLSSFGADINKLCPFSNDNSVSLDNVMNSYVNSLPKPEIDRKLLNVRGSSAEVLQMSKQEGKTTDDNIRMPQPSRNFINHGVTKPVLSHTPDGEGLVIKNSDTISDVEFNRTEKLDWSFLTLGIGGNTEARYKSIVSGRNITGNTGRVIPSQLNTYLSQKAKSSSLSRGLDKSGVISRFQNDVGGMSTLVHNVGGWTSCNNDCQVMPGTGTGCSSNASYALQTTEVDKQHHVSMPRNVSLGLEVGQNRDERFSNIDPNPEVQSHPAMSSKPLVSSQTGMPAPGQSWATGLSLLSSFIESTTQPVSDQLWQCYLESSRDFSSVSSIVSPSIALTGSTTRQFESGILGPPEIIVPFHFSKNMIGHAFTTGQGAPGAEGNKTAQASTDLVGPSLKRSANEPPAAIKAQRRKTKTLRPSITPSMQTVTPIAPSLPNLAQSAPALPTLLRTTSASSRPPLSWSVSSQLQKALHIKWKGFNETPQPIGENCLLCKRNLSFKPDGPVFHSTVPPTVAILPCHHTFHRHCLQLITPEDQANNPPCIPCAIGES